MRMSLVTGGLVVAHPVLASFRNEQDPFGSFIGGGLASRRMRNTARSRRASAPGSHRIAFGEMIGSRET